MSTSARSASKMEQRAICFLMFEKVAPTEIYLRLKAVYGDSVISIQHVREYYIKFKDGRMSITDEEREEKPSNMSITEL